jgi:glyoxylase-like metal-dependent hydrolase (beta-lactamase superfamily II)
MTPIPELPPGQRAGAGEWTEAGAYRVAAGVHRIPLPLPGDGLRAVNVYAIEDGPRIVLVDAGWQRDECWDALREGLRRIGAEIPDVERVLVTHMHRDHYGQATRLRSESGAPLLIGEMERRSLETVTDEQRMRDSLRARGEEMHRWGAATLAEEIESAMRGGGFGGVPRAVGAWGAPDVYAGDGAVVEMRSRRLRVVHTPGHTRGHVVFADEEHRLLFSGDHVLPHITPSLGFEPYSDGRALIDYLASLARVRTLPADRVLPAHGPDFSGLAERVDALGEHHAARLDACLAAVRSGCRSVLEVAQALRWTRRERRYDELDLFNRLLAVIETAAHLELLVARATLTAVDRDGVREHRLPASAEGAAESR